MGYSIISAIISRHLFNESRYKCIAESLRVLRSMFKFFFNHPSIVLLYTSVIALRNCIQIIGYFGEIFLRKEGILSP